MAAISTLAVSPKIYYRLPKSHHSPIKTHLSQSGHSLHLTRIRCCSKPEKDNGLLKRWDAPWNWQTVSLTSLACGLSYDFTGPITMAVFQYSGLNNTELSLEQVNGIFLVRSCIRAIVVLTVLFRMTKSSSSLPDIYRYDLREPFNLKRGWLLWAIIGFGGVNVASRVTQVASSFFMSQDVRASLPPLLRSRIIFACTLGDIGVLSPIVEETFFRGFLLVAVTKWLPTMFSIFVSAAAFAGAHFPRGTSAADDFIRRQFPNHFAFGIVVGLSYAHTRNLLTPIIIHGLWNSSIILTLLFSMLRGV